MSRLVRIVTVYLGIVILAGVGANLAAAAEATRTPVTTDQRLAGHAEVTFTIGDDAITGPAEIPAGPTLLTQVNATAEDAHFFVLRVPDEMTDEEFAAEMSAEETGDWFWTATIVGNPDRAAPRGGSAVALVNIVPGRYAVVDPIHPRRSHAFVATGEGAPMPAVEADVRAEMFEMAFEMPVEIPVGPLVLDVANTGGAMHEVAIVPVPDGATAEDVVGAFGLAFEGTPVATGLGDAWAGWDGIPVAGVGVTSPGGRVLAQIDLAPGTYVAVCFFPTEDFVPHLMVGMTKVFTVTEASV